MDHEQLRFQQRTVHYPIVKSGGCHLLVILLITWLLLGCTPATGEVAGTAIVERENGTPEQSQADPATGPTSTRLSATKPSNKVTSPPPAADITMPASTLSPTDVPTPVDDTSDAAAAASITEDQLNDPELITYGLDVYQQQYCGVCHQLDAANTGGMFGPSQNEIGQVAQQRIQDSDYTGAATTAAEYIRESILDPAIYLVEGYAQSRHHMPAFTHLGEAEIDALVAMLLQQK